VDIQTSPVILVVEDEWLVREDIAAEFRRAGWTVLEASTGEGAIGLLESDEQVDALVTDIQLAGRATGLDVADAFHERHPELPVIYTSGNPVEAGRLVPGSKFIPKPCIPADLVAACGRRAPMFERISFSPL
jgi:CheY-like chemotaxis protein